MCNYRDFFVTRMGFEPMIFSVKGKRLKPLVQRTILTASYSFRTLRARIINPQL